MFKALGLIAYHHRDRGSIIGDSNIVNSDLWPPTITAL
jgi:hypothetical protein